MGKSSKINSCQRILQVQSKSKSSIYLLWIKIVNIRGLREKPPNPHKKNKPCLNRVKPRFCNFYIDFDPDLTE